MKYTGFSSPTSVLYDAEQDRYLVANTNGGRAESWEPSSGTPAGYRGTVYRGTLVGNGKLGGSFGSLVALADQKSPGYIAYDTKRGHVLVPHTLDDTVEAYDLK